MYTKLINRKNIAKHAVSEQLDPSCKVSITTDKTLILEEVIVRQEDNLKAFILGLELLGLRSVIKIYPTLIKPLFTHQDQAPLTADRFRMLIGSVRPGSDDERSNRFFCCSRPCV